MLSVRATLTVAVLILAGLFGLKAYDRFSADLASARADADSARAVAASAVVSARNALEVAAVNDARIAKADTARIVALSDANKYKTLYAAAKQAAPAPCAPLIAAADTALAASEAARIAAENKAALLEISLHAVRPALQQLVPATIQLSAATVTLENATRPSLLIRLRPKIGVGAAVGVDVQGKPNVVTGFTLSWTF